MNTKSGAVLDIADLFDDIKENPVARPNVFVETAYTRLRYLMTERYPNELSVEHELALREGIVALAHEMLTGERTGRFAVALPCGQGKTTAIRAILWTIAKLKLPYTVTVACYKVEQLCSLKRQLVGEDTHEANGDGIDASLVGLRHSYEFNAVRANKYIENSQNELPSDHASELSEGHDRQFLLVTHEAVKAGEDLPLWLDRDITFYDESLVVSESRVLTLLAEHHSGLFSEISQIKDLAKYHDHERWGDAARWLSQVKERLITKLDDLEKRVQGVHILAMPELKPEVIKKLRRLLPERNWPNVHKLIEFANEKLRVSRDSRGHALITYTITVPDALENVIITDASDPIRELVKHDSTIRNVELVRPALKQFAECGLGVIKRFDDVSIYHRRESGGREAMSINFRSESNKVMRDIIEIIDAKPDEEFLIFTYKERDGVDFIKLINKKLGGRRYFDDMSVRTHILTWGNETALNDYAHVQNVIMAGVMLQPMSALAGQYMGQKRNVQQIDATDEQTLRRLRYSEASHLVYQGANRGAMRQTRVDTEGRSQAMPCNLYVIHYDKELRKRLDRVMPGAKWQSWKGKDEIESIYGEALKLQDYLTRKATEGTSKVSIKQAKADAGIKLVGKGWIGCRNTALDNVAWSVTGQSFVLTFAPLTS